MNEKYEQRINDFLRIIGVFQRKLRKRSWKLKESLDCCFHAYFQMEWV